MLVKVKLSCMHKPCTPSELSLQKVKVKLSCVNKLKGPNPVRERVLSSEGKSGAFLYARITGPTAAGLQDVNSSGVGTFFQSGKETLSCAL